MVTFRNTRVFVSQAHYDINWPLIGSCPSPGPLIGHCISPSLPPNVLLIVTCYHTQLATLQMTPPGQINILHCAINKIGGHADPVEEPNSGQEETCSVHQWRKNLNEKPSDGDGRDKHSHKV